MHEMGVFDKWFEGIGYHNSVFYDNEAPNCRWPWNGTKSAGWTWNGTECMTQVNASTVGAGYLTSELGNRTIEWIQRVSAEPVRRPWFVYFATFAPHGPGNPPLYTAAEWYKDTCVGVESPRSHPNFNYSGHNHTSCSLYPPGSSSFGGNGSRSWWNGTDFPELTSCQRGFTEAQAQEIDLEARHCCQALLSVDDTYSQVKSLTMIWIGVSLPRSDFNRGNRTRTVIHLPRPTPEPSAIMFLFSLADPGRSGRARAAEQHLHFRYKRSRLQPRQPHDRLCEDASIRPLAPHPNALRGAWDQTQQQTRLAGDAG